MVCEVYENREPLNIPMVYRGYALNKTGPWLFIAQCSTNCIPVTLPVAVLAAALWQPAPKETTTLGNKTNSDANMNNIIYVHIYIPVNYYVRIQGYIMIVIERFIYKKQEPQKKSLIYWKSCHEKNDECSIPQLGGSCQSIGSPPPPCLVFASPCFKKLLKFQQLLILTIHTCQGGFSQGTEKNKGAFPWANKLTQQTNKNKPTNQPTNKTNKQNQNKTNKQTKNTNKPTNQPTNQQTNKQTAEDPNSQQQNPSVGKWIAVYRASFWYHPTPAKTRKSSKPTTIFGVLVFRLNTRFCTTYVKWVVKMSASFQVFCRGESYLCFAVAVLPALSTLNEIKNDGKPVRNVVRTRKRHQSLPKSRFQLTCCKTAVLPTFFHANNPATTTPTTTTITTKQPQRRHWHQGRPSN